MENEDEIKQQALIDNTAQGIFIRLKEIENKREIYERLWIWELLQNALDAAHEDRKTDVEIIKNEDTITFRHNGRFFKPEEVAHLIYHGSTKREIDIGRFGTGFLTTHLLSRKIKVRGVREDYKTFEFELDRNGKSSEELKTRMELTWEQYKQSLRENNGNQNYATEFIYPLSSISSNTVDAGIEDLIKLSPYILAFNDKLGSVKIINPTHEIKFKFDSQIEENSNINKVIREDKNGTEIHHDLLILKDDDLQIALERKKHSDEIYHLESLHGIPKIFLAFPLFGTQDLSFPAIVNSRKFEPTEKRDGIFLGKENTDEINQNKNRLKKAKTLFITYISNSNSNEWDNIHTMLTFYPPVKKDWLDQEWYIELSTEFIREIAKLDVLKTESGNFISLEKGFIPILDNQEKEKVEMFWDLTSHFLEYKDKIPAKKITFNWKIIIDGWNNFSNDFAGIEITLLKIADKIEACGKLQDFKSKLDQSKNEFEILNGFYKLLLDNNEQRMFDIKNILPDQHGIFRKKAELFKDQGIDNTLKDISEKLENNIRSQLLDFNINENVQNLLSEKNQDEVLNQILSLIKKPKTNDEQYLQANIDLFSWLLEHDKFEYFEGYPLITSKEETFQSMGKSNKEKLLSPKEFWSETAQKYSSLFPQDFIISSSYHEKNSNYEKWGQLKNEGMILIDPLYVENVKLSRDDLESLLLIEEKLEEENDHEILEDVEVSKIAFLETDDKGIINTVRKSKEKCRKFLHFLFDYIAEEDTKWFDTFEVNCTCGSKHKISPAIWMGPLKSKKWVPVRQNKSDMASVQNLALLLDGYADLLQNCRQYMPSRLLNKLNISIGELMMRVVAKDEKVKLELDIAMGSLFSTFVTDPTQLGKIAQLAEIEPDLFIMEMEKRLQTREQIHKNQSIGAAVENNLKNILEKEGFKVERTGVGSDFLIEYDFISEEKEMIFEVKKENKIYFYIEVKATSQNFVKMTLPQAKEARDKSDKYALCVVYLNSPEIEEDDIKNAVKFIPDIGERIKDKVYKAENLEYEHDLIGVADDIEIEINEGPIRFKINKRIWNVGKTLEQFKDFIISL